MTPYGYSGCTAMRAAQGYRKRTLARGSHLNALLLLFAASMVGCRIGSFTDVRPHANRAACQENLKSIGAALTKYVAAHNELPRSSSGETSLTVAMQDPQVQMELGVDATLLRCPGDASPAGMSYIFNPALTAADIAPDSTTVVACDRQPVHPGISGATDSPTSVILLGNGAVTTMYLPQEEREKWIKLFLAGDKRACTHPPEGKR
jgi:hypothetical protein